MEILVSIYIIIGVLIATAAISAAVVLKQNKTITKVRWGRATLLVPVMIVAWPFYLTYFLVKTVLEEDTP